jgi:hypothetical protein
MPPAVVLNRAVTVNRAGDVSDEAVPTQSVDPSKLIAVLPVKAPPTPGVGVEKGSRSYPPDVIRSPYGSPISPPSTHMPPVPGAVVLWVTASTRL